MRSIRRILVAIRDPQSGLTPAVAKAAQLARATKAHVELFHAIATPMYVDGYAASGVELPTLERTTQARALAQLEKLAKRLRNASIRVSVAAEWDFPAYEAVLRRARRFGADLIVADQHPGRHRAAGLLHLTDWELLRLSPVPVLLVKKGGLYRKPVVLAAVDPGHTYAKPARLDREILSAGSAVSRALGGTLHALHAYVPFPWASDPQTMINPQTIERIEKEAAAEARAGLDRALRAAKLPKAQRHVLGRHPADAIAQAAGKLHSSIVVMGAISRSGLKRVFIGNTAERVLDLLECDVLVVKPAHFASRIPQARRGVRIVAVNAAPLPF